MTGPQIGNASTLYRNNHLIDQCIGRRNEDCITVPPIGWVKRGAVIYKLKETKVTITSGKWGIVLRDCEASARTYRFFSVFFSSIHSRRIVSREKVPGNETVCYCRLLLTEVDRRYIYFFIKNPQGTIYEISSHRTTFNENLSVRAIANILRVRASEHSSNFVST